MSQRRQAAEWAAAHVFLGRGWRAAVARAARHSRCRSGSCESIRLDTRLRAAAWWTRIRPARSVIAALVFLTCWRGTMALAHVLRHLGLVGAAGGALQPHRACHQRGSGHHLARHPRNPVAAGQARQLRRGPYRLGERAESAPNRYRMWYTAGERYVHFGERNRGIVHVGAASSTDGINWKKAERQPSTHVLARWTPTKPCSASRTPSRWMVCTTCGSASIPCRRAASPLIQARNTSARRMRIAPSGRRSRVANLATASSTHTAPTASPGSAKPASRSWNFAGGFDFEEPVLSHGHRHGLAAVDVLRRQRVRQHRHWTRHAGKV